MIQTHTTIPRASRTASAGVSYAVQMVSLCGTLTRAVIATRMLKNTARTTSPASRSHPGMSRCRKSALGKLSRRSLLLVQVDRHGFKPYSPDGPRARGYSRFSGLPARHSRRLLFGGKVDPRHPCLRNRCGIAVYRDGERSERGEVTLDEAAGALNVSPMTVLRMIRRGVLGARQLCKGAPWVIRAADLSDDAVHAEANGRRRQPLTQNPNQQVFTFQ